MSKNAKYLGLPLFIGRVRRKVLEDVKAKVLSKVAGWKERALSHAISLLGPLLSRLWLQSCLCIVCPHFYYLKVGVRKLTGILKDF